MRVRHGGFVRVEAHADILNVEDQRVDALQHGGGGPAGGAVEAEDLDSGLGIDGVLDAGAVFLAEEAVLGREEGGDLDAGAARIRSILRRPWRSMPVWLVMRPMRLPWSGAKLLLDEDVEAGLGRCRCGRPRGGRRGRRAVSLYPVRATCCSGDADGGGGDGGDLGAQRGDGRAQVGVDAVGEQDHVALAWTGSIQMEVPVKPVWP